MTMMIRSAVYLGFLVSASAFSTPPGTTQSRKRIGTERKSGLIKSSPSDSSESEEDFSAFGYGSPSKAVVDVDATADDSAGQVLVNKVLDVLPTNFGEVSSETQLAVNELLYKLEPLNPHPDPALSPLINGVWELRYAGGYTDDVSTCKGF